MGILFYKRGSLINDHNGWQQKGRREGGGGAVRFNQQQFNTNNRRIRQELRIASRPKSTL